MNDRENGRIRLANLLRTRAAESSDDLCAQDQTGAQLTWGQLLQRSSEVAAGLADEGFGRGSVVAWQLPTSLDALVLMFALSRLECLQVPLLPVLGERDLTFICREAEAALLVTPRVWRGKDYAAQGRGIAQALAAEGATMRLVAVDDLPVGDPGNLPALDPATDAPVRWCFYTSGSTGNPKGVLHTDASIHASSVAVCERWRVTASDRFVFNYPMSHIGAVGWLAAALSTGFSSLLLDAFEPDPAIRLMRDFQITIAGAGPPFHQAYLAAQLRLGAHERVLPDIRMFPSGGSPKPASLHGALKDATGVGISSTYGSTESPMTTMTSLDDPDDVLSRTEGRAVPGARIRIAGPGDVVLPDGEQGEVQLRSEQLFVGYLDSRLDDSAFTEDGWFRTGDLGRLDERGNLTITGRLKDVIIRNMENVSAREVEELLITHPRISDVAVIGLPDERTGERVCAVCTLHEGELPFGLDELFAWCVEQGLTKQKIPEQLEFVDALPRQGMGKIVKTSLREMFAQA